MALNKPMQLALKLLSPDIDMKKVYKLHRRALSLKEPHVLRFFYEMWDHKVLNGDREVLVRLYPPGEEKRSGLLLFFHGGGWVVENINTYNRVCLNLARHMGCRVASVEYSLAPETPFPGGLEDCYAVAREILHHPELFGLSTQEITLIGDSAGGNLAAALSLLARDRGEFTIPRQILLYPAVYDDHNEATSPFDSVRENGEGYLLTSRRIEDYMSLYLPDPAQRKNPYVAPLYAPDLSHQPNTLLITAEYDPLRDEGEAYAEALRKAGNQVTSYRMPDALHGFFSFDPHLPHVKKAYELIEAFLDGALPGKEEPHCQ